LSDNEYQEWLSNAIKNKEIVRYDYSSFGDFQEIRNEAYSTVHSANLTTENKTVVLKSVTLCPSFTLESLVNELKHYLNIKSHENIVDFYGITQKDENQNAYEIVMEFANDGALDIYLELNFTKLEWTNKLRFAQQIAEAIMHLHSNNIIHGNLNPRNVLVHNGSIKISDFGIYRITTLPSISLLKLTGSLEYSDPVFLKEMEKYSRTKAFDIYSIGMLFWQISSGQCPYRSNHFQDELDLVTFITNGNREAPIMGTPTSYVKIYQECWGQDINKRPIIDKVVQDLKNVDLTEIVKLNNSIINEQVYLSEEKFDNFISKTMRDFISDKRNIDLINGDS
ncbi:10145_t:CDS:2, partial [Acaulospora morrowiae]